MTVTIGTRLRRTAGDLLTRARSLVCRRAPTPPGSSAATALAVKITDLTGPDHSARFGISGTDLGVPIITPDGQLLLVFGDTWAGDGGSGGDTPDWRTPTGLYADPDSVREGLRWTGAARGSLPWGDAGQAGQLVPQPHGAIIHGARISTQLPSDVVRVDDVLYLQVMGNVTFPDVAFTEIYASQDNGRTWASTGCSWRGDHWNGWFQCLTFHPGDDGYLYCFSTDFRRCTGLMLSRVRLEAMLDPDAWEPWGWSRGRGWCWGGPPAQVLEGRFGESSLRRVDDRWALVVFDCAHYRIDVRVLPSITVDMTTVPVTTVIEGVDWGDEDHARGRVAQPYGGFVLPGSTLDDLHLVVSQWHVAERAPYRAMQFRTSLPASVRR